MTAAIRLKHLCDQWGEYGLGVSAEQYVPSGIRLIRTSDITDDGELIPEEHGVFVDSSTVDGLRLRTGDLLVSRSGTIGRSFLFDEQRHGHCTFAAYLVRFRLKSGHDPRFIYYFTKSAPFYQQVQLDATQATIANFNAQKLGNLQLPAFRPGQQVAIADFLDRETARIDELFVKKRELREMLKSQRRVLADETLWRSAPNIARVKNAIRSITSGPRGWSEHFSDQGQPFLRITNVSANSIDLVPEDLVRVTPPGGLETERTRANAGDVVVSITAEIGSVGVISENLAGSYVSQHLALLRTDRRIVDPSWLALCFFGSEAQGQLDSARYGGTKTQLSLEDVVQVRIPLPPIDTQSSLIAEWRSKDEMTNAAIRKMDDQLGLLVEHRAALVTAAVTGQIQAAEAP